MKNKILLRDKILEKPIIQGGMGVGVSLSKLAGAVMKEGAMGVISAAHPGYRKKSFLQDSVKANCEAILEEVQKAKVISEGRGLCGVNVMVASKNYEDYVNAAIQAGADVLISGAGLPMELPRIAKEKDILLAPIVSSARAARLLLRAWDCHDQCTPDFIVIEGSEAGGHLGFKKEDLVAHTTQCLEEILAEVLQVLPVYEERYGHKIPLFVAGGIYDKKDILHYQEAGASGVQIATRFIATYECDAHPNFKQKILEAKKQDIEFVQSPAGLPGRAILTKHIQKSRKERIPSTHCIQCMKPCTPASAPYCISEALIAAVRGDVENGLVFAGSTAYRIHQMMSVHDLIQELTQ